MTTSPVFGNVNGAPGAENFFRLSQHEFSLGLDLNRHQRATRADEEKLPAVPSGRHLSRDPPVD